MRRQVFENLYENWASTPTGMAPAAEEVAKKKGKIRDFLAKHSGKAKTGAKVAAGVAATAGVAYGGKKVYDKYSKKGKGKKKKGSLKESIENNFQITGGQYLFDKKVIENLRDMSESQMEFIDSRNDYFISQRDAALEQGFIDAAEYYDDRIK
jgi:hypothetical protein